jgi:hypothetical protein
VGLVLRVAHVSVRLLQATTVFGQRLVILGSTERIPVIVMDVPKSQQPLTLEVEVVGAPLLEQVVEARAERSPGGAVETLDHSPV